MRISDIILSLAVVVLLGIVFFREPNQSVIPDYYKEEIIKSQKVINQLRADEAKRHNAWDKVLTDSLKATDPFIDSMHSDFLKRSGFN